MPRPMWTGVIGFGLVSIPVRLFTAVQAKDVRFHQMHRDTNERVQHKKVVASKDGDEVTQDDIVKGYELPDGRYVTITPEELEALEPGRSRTIDIEQFVELDQIDPIHFERSYYLAPVEDAGADKPYALLLDALERSGRIGIGRFVMRSKQHLAAIRAAGGVLILETLYFADEVREPSSVGHLPDDIELSDRERTMAGQLIDSMTEPWDPDRYHDTYREAVLELIDQKAAGQAIELPSAEEPAARVIDLMAALEASLAGERGDRGAAPSADAADDGDGGTASGDDDHEPTRDELYERAQELGIPGRSKMSRDELAEAVAEAEASRAAS